MLDRQFIEAGLGAVASLPRMAELWTVEVFRADDGTIPYQQFGDSLSDFKFAALDMAIKHVLASRGLDLAGSHWLKPLGEGLHEFRIRHEARDIARMFDAEAPSVGTKKESVLLRIFVHFHGEKVVLLLGGYDKGRSPKAKRQQREIERARKLLAQYKERRRRERRRDR